MAKRVATGFILFLGVTFALWFYWTPPLDDDLHYMGYFRDYILGGGDYPWSRVKDMIVSEWHANNIRWVNMITAFTHTVMPKWAVALIHGLCVILIMRWSVKLAGAKGKLLSILVIIAMITLCLPWHANLGFMVYAHNYVLPSAVFTGFFILWFKRPAYQSPLALTGLLLLGIIAGESHEGFSLPALCGIIFYWICSRRVPSTRQIVMTVGFLIGIAILLSAEGKTSRTVITLSHSFAQWAYTLLFYSPLFAVMIAVLSACLVRQKKKFWSILLSSPMSLFFGIAVSAFIMSGLLSVNCRASWFGELAAIIVTVNMWNRCMPRVSAPWFPRVKNAFSVLIILLVSAHMLTVDVYALRCDNDYKIILARYLKDPESTIYLDYTSSADVPLITFGKVISSYPWIGEYPGWKFRDFYCPGSSTANVVPARLRDFSIDKAVKMPGDNPFYLYKGEWIAPKDSVRFLQRFLFTFRVTRRASGVNTLPFTSFSGDSLTMCDAWLIDRVIKLNPVIKIDRE